MNDELEYLRFRNEMANRLIPSLYKAKKSMRRFLHEKNLIEEYIQWLKQQKEEKHESV